MKLYQNLKELVELFGDDVLYDSDKVMHVLSRYVNFDFEAYEAVSNAIKGHFVDIFHQRYIWDSVTISKIDEFASKYYIPIEIMEYIGEAFAFSIDLIEEVNQENSPTKELVRTINRRLGAAEIKQLQKAIPCSDDNIFLLPHEPKVLSDGIEITAYVIGKFSNKFKGGVFHVKYYNYEGKYMKGWYNKSVYTIPLTKYWTPVRGKISIKLDPIFIRDEIKKIELSFINFEKESEDIDLNDIDISWIDS